MQKEQASPLTPFQLDFDCTHYTIKSLSVKPLAPAECVYFWEKVKKHQENEN